MSTVQEIQAAIPKLTPEELADLKEWLDDFVEDQLELTEEVKAKLDQSRTEMAAGQYRTRQPSRAVSAALQIWSHTCCKALDQLPAAIQESIQRKVDEMGLRLGSYPHHRLTGRSECRLRVGDYRVGVRTTFTHNAPSPRHGAGFPETGQGLPHRHAPVPLRRACECSARLSRAGGLV